MRAVIYAAKSTQDTHGSIPTQLADGRKLAAGRGFEVVGEHQDEAFSAFHGDRGPGLAKALAECEQLSAEHGSCALVVQHSDRLARGDGKQARSLVELVVWAIKHDVELLSVQDPEILAGGDLALVLGALGGMRNHQDSKRKSLAVRDGMKRRAERGQFIGGRPPYGYEGGAEGLVPVPAQAAVVVRVFTAHVHGSSQRSIARDLNADGIRTATGKLWAQSGIARVLSNPTYKGLLPVKGEDGEPLPGSHEAIVDADLWERAQVRGEHRRKGGRHAEGAHLLVRGLLRCRCGAGMIARKARPGVERERYVCAARQADRDSCSQSSIRRELIDEPLLATLLDGYIDFDATRRRIEDRANSVLTVAREALSQAEREAASVDYDRRLARATRGWQDEVIDDDEYARQRAELNAEREGAQEALRRSQGHVEEVEQGAIPGDGEQALLEHLAALKKAVATGAGAAPDLHALRNVIGQMFERVQLVRSGEVPDCDVPMTDDAVPVSADYWLLLVLRPSAVDSGTFKPIGQEMPVGSMLQYPPSDTKPFFARYCWW
jgi:DNA invertase Pin-like site-specific DNA recombinase